MDSQEDRFFQVSVKGLFFDAEKVMMAQEQNGKWDFPGGRMQKGESFIECLTRECLEETGLVPEVLDDKPYIVYPTVDQEGRPRIMVFFKVKFNSIDFKPSDECVALKFFNRDEVKQLSTYYQLKDLSNLL